jgi:hypothetical protein
LRTGGEPADASRSPALCSSWGWRWILRPRWRRLLTKHLIRRFGCVAEVADACVFLCVGEAGFGFLTGSNISIEGAYSRV